MAQFGKPPITVIQEYCAKNHLEKPEYEVMEENDVDGKCFVASVSALGAVCQGAGRSKKDAKHDAARNLIKRMKYSHPGLDDIPAVENTDSESIPNFDSVKQLRDLCCVKSCPLPQFNLIQQAGPPESPEFKFECIVGHIKRYGVGTTKKAAKQVAAFKIIEIISSFQNDTDNDNQVVSVDQVMEDTKVECYKKFKTYWELTESDEKQDIGRKFSDRHKFFQLFFPEVRTAAFHILSNPHYVCDREKVVDLLKSMNLAMKISTLRMSNLRECLVIDIPCEIDVVFINTADKIFAEILKYFQTMLS